MQSPSCLTFRRRRCCAPLFALRCSPRLLLCCGSRISSRQHSGGGGGGGGGGDDGDTDARRGLLAPSPVRDGSPELSSGGSSPSKRKNSDMNEEFEDEAAVENGAAAAGPAAANAPRAAAADHKPNLTVATNGVGSAGGGGGGGGGGGDGSGGGTGPANGGGTTTTSPPPPNNRVSFGHATVREYDRCLTDHPCVSTGVPLGLDWPFQEHSPEAIDAFEATRRAEGRLARDEYAVRGRLSTQTRLALALRAGHEMRECERVAADVEETKLRRYESAFRDTGGGGGGGGGSGGGRQQRRTGKQQPQQQGGVVSWASGVARFLFSS